MLQISPEISRAKLVSHIPYVTKWHAIIPLNRKRMIDNMHKIKELITQIKQVEFYYLIFHSNKHPKGDRSDKWKSKFEGRKHTTTNPQIQRGSEWEEFVP